MDKKVGGIKKDLRKQLIVGIVFSVMLVAGIPAIVLSAVNSIWPVMVLGIICTVLGFYGTPLVWTSYGNNVILKRVVDAVMEENLTTNADIAGQLQMSEKTVKGYIVTGIKKKYITGYIYNGEVLTPNQKEAPKKKIVQNKCKNCGGPLKATENGWRCEYCGSEFDKE